MEKINYENYVVYPYTIAYLKKNYSNEVFQKYGDQLAYLYQNGFDISDNHCLQSIEEQLSLFNFLETVEDFEEAIGGSRIQTPTKVGYKIVDSLLEVIIKKTPWAVQKFNDIQKFGEIYLNDIEKCCNSLSLLEKSKDDEIKLVYKEIADDEFVWLLNRCKEVCESKRFGIALISYQKLYRKVIAIHQKILGITGNPNKGETARIGNINDELYGSAGCYNPQSDFIKAYNGSAVYELKQLSDSNINTKDIENQMSVIAKECKSNGEDDELILEFASGDHSRIEEVREALAEICFNGIVVLLGLKHDVCTKEMNKKRCENALEEIEAIRKYTSFSKR